ncbi:MAG: hypothetical protein ABIU05_27955 [Nitrospirales bacterium]
MKSQCPLAAMNITSRRPQFYLFLPLFLIFFAVPYVFDLVFCEELYATPLSQAALIDAEKVDPDDGTVSLSSLDLAATEEMSELPTAEPLVQVSFLTSGGFKSPIPLLLTSRPPPAS